MDIEEERKAFDKCFIFSEERFEIWLAAKAHAAETAKPTVKVTRSTNSKTSYPFVVSLFEGEVFNGVLEDFKTEADAEEWAKCNGYRVIE